MYSESTMNHIKEFLFALAKVNPKCPVDAGVLQSGCAVVMSQPELSVWCPACVLFTRFVLLVIYPSNRIYQRAFVASFVEFKARFEEQALMKCWEIELFGVVSLDERYLSIPDKIWGVAADYCSLENAMDTLASQTTEVLTNIERTASLHQLFNSKKPFRVPGPLTMEGGDVDLMLFFYGKQYYHYQKVHTLITEEFSDPDSWLPVLDNFLEEEIIHPIYEVKGEDPISLYKGKCDAYSPLLGMKELKESHIPELLCYILEHSRSRVIIRTLRSVNGFSKEATLDILASIQQYYLEVSSTKVRKFNHAREVGQLAQDMKLGANLAIITLVDAIASMRKSKTKKETSQTLAAILAVQLYQLPSPELHKRLPAPLTFLSLEIFDMSRKLRSRVFASLLLKDLDQLGIRNSPKLSRKILQALDSLPLYLETKGITTVTEKVCMVASQFAPVDFDQLDIIYDKVIYLLVRDDYRIDKLLRDLQELTSNMLDPLSTWPVKAMSTYAEFLPIIEQVCHIVHIAFSVYSPVFDTIYDMVA